MKRSINIIIPAKNRLKLLKNTVSSALSQKINENLDSKIIIIDDLSDTPLKKQIRTSKNLLVTENKGSNHGPGPTRNVGLNLSKSDYVCFLDSDDKLESEMVQISVNLLENSNCIATISLVRPYFEDGYPFYEQLKSALLNLIRNLFLLSFYFLNDKKLPKPAFFLSHISGMFFKRRFLKGISFNEKVKASEDWEFVARVLERGDIVIIPKLLSTFRYNKESNTNKVDVKSSRPNDYISLLNRLLPEFRRGAIHVLFLLYISFLKIGIFAKKMKARSFYLYEYVSKIPKFTDWYMVFVGFIFTGKFFLVRMKYKDLNFVANHYIDLMTLLETYQDKQYDIGSKNKLNVIDIGANIGDFSIKAAVDGAVNVYAYEPVRSTYELLQSNIAINGIKNVKSFNYGVSNLMGKSLINVSPASGLSSLFSGSRSKKTEEIRLVTIDKIFRENNIKKCDLLKVDCEGAEYDIFTNLSAKIFDKIDNIAVEFHEGITGRSKYELVDIFRTNGFKVVVKNHQAEDKIGLIIARKNNA